MVAELAKAQRPVQHGHRPREREEAADLPQPVVHQRRHGAGKGDRQQPRDPTVRALARVEVAAHGAAPGAQPGVNGVVERKGAGLLDQQRQQNGQETHARMIVGCAA